MQIFEENSGYLSKLLQLLAAKKSRISVQENSSLVCVALTVAASSLGFGFPPFLLYPYRPKSYNKLHLTCISLDMLNR